MQANMHCCITVDAGHVCIFRLRTNVYFAVECPPSLFVVVCVNTSTQTKKAIVVDYPWKLCTSPPALSDDRFGSAVTVDAVF